MIGLLLFLTLAQAGVKKAYFAGGCFWCVQQSFDGEKKNGVVSTRVGYSGGKVKNPTYEQVNSGESEHIEAIEVEYDSKKISYSQLLDIFWKNIDPLDSAGQFCDKGSQYKSAVFYLTNEEKKVVELSKKELPKKLKTQGVVATLSIPFEAFYPAEDYHQAYYKKNPLGYGVYKKGCGRDSKLLQIWK